MLPFKTKLHFLQTFPNEKMFYHTGNVVNPELFIPDPGTTFQAILDLNPDPNPKIGHRFQHSNSQPTFWPDHLATPHPT